MGEKEYGIGEGTSVGKKHAKRVQPMSYQSLGTWAKLMKIKNDQYSFKGGSKILRINKQQRKGERETESWDKKTTQKKNRRGEYK